VGLLIGPEFVNLPDDVAQHFVVVQLVFLLFLGQLLLRLWAILCSPLDGHLSAVFGSVDAHACTLDLLLAR
jgi:hypothetical protein